MARENLRLTFAELPTDRLVSNGYVPHTLRELCADGSLTDYVSPDHPNQNHMGHALPPLEETER